MNFLFYFFRKVKNADMNIPCLAAYLLWNQKQSLEETESWEWGKVTDFCCQAGLENLLFFRLKEHPENPCPALYYERLSNFFDLSFARFSRMKAEVAELTEDLQKAGIEAGFIKGFPLALHYYPHPAARPMQDVDCIAREEDFPGISERLLQKGYSRLPDQSKIEKKPVFIKLLGPYIFSFEFHSKLHTSYSRGNEGLWTLDKNGNPAPEELFLSVLLHAKYFESSLRHFIDLGMILSKTPLQWEKVYAYAEKERLLHHALIQKKIFKSLFPETQLWLPPHGKQTPLTLRDKSVYGIRKRWGIGAPRPRSRQSKILDALMHFLVYDKFYFALHTWLNKYLRFVRLEKYTRWMAGKFI